MAGGDISATLRVNVVVDTSGAEAQIRDAISKINTGNNVIRLRADASDALKEIHSLQSEIQALGKKPVSFGVTSAFGKMVNNGFGAASEQLSNINKQIQALSSNGVAVKSISRVSGAIENIKSDPVTEATDAVGKLTTALDELQSSSSKVSEKGAGGVFKGGTNSWVTKMNSATKQIESMEMFYNKMKSIPGLDENFGENLTSYRSAIDEYINLQNKLESGGIKRSDYNNQLVQVVKQASEAKVALQEVADVQKELNAERELADKEAKANILSKDSSAYKSSVLETTRQIEAMQSFYDKMNGIAGLDKSGENELRRYASVLNDMKRLNTDLNRGDMDRGGYISRFTNLTEEASKAKIALEQVAEVQKKYNTEQAANDKKAQADILTKDNPAFKSNMLQVSRQIESMEKFSNSMNKIAGLDQSGAAELQRYTSALKEMKNLSADLDKGSMTKGEFNTRFANVAKEASEAKIALQQVADAQKQLNAEQAKNQEHMFEDGSVKQQNALREISKLQQEIAQNQQKWSAAKTGSSAKQYEEYVQQGQVLNDLNEQVKNCTTSEEKYAESVSQVKTKMQECSTAISGAGENTQGFGAQLAGAFKYFSMYFGMTRMVMQGIQTVKQMVQASIDIESAMNRIQIVTGATDSQMTQFFDSASQQAQDLGQNITDVASSIETFSRLGYSLSDATDLSKYATIMSNVADTTVDAATTGLTSIIKGFGMEASDAEHVSDVLINVGQKYAISAEELMEAFERGGAAMNASGTSFEQSAALFAATNASLQNASTTGTMWKTVSARIRSAKTELEEMGESTEDLADGFSKYRNEIKALTGFDIMKNENEYKSMYDIFVGLAQVWDNIKSDEARARVSEILGGTRNLSGIASTIQNINDAIGAYEVAMNSSGVAEEANAKHMETTEAHIGQLKASFQELSSDVFNSDAMKVFIDGGKAIIDTIDTMVDSLGAVPTAFALISGGIIAFNSLRSNFVPFIKEIGDGIKGITKAVSDKGGLVAGLTSISGLSATALAGVAAAAVAIPLIIRGYQQYQQHLEDLRLSSQQSSQAYMDQADSFEDSYKKVSELRGKLDSGTLSDAEEYQVRSQILDIQNQLVDSYGAQASALDLVNGKLDEQQTKMEDINVQAANQLLNYDIDKNTLNKATEVMEGMYGGKYGKHLGMQTFTAKDLADSTKNAAKEQKVLEKLADDYKDVVQLTKQVDEETNSTAYAFKYTGKTKDVRKNLEGFMNDLRNAKDEIGGDTPFLDAIFKGTQEAVSEADSLISKYEDIYNAAERAKLVSDDTPYADKSGEGKSAYKWLNEYSDAINKYNDALLSGDSKDRLEAANNFRSVSDSIDYLTGSGGGLEQYKDQFDEIGKTLNKTGATQEELAEVLSGDYVSDATRDVKLYGDALKELKLSDADFMNAFLNKGGDNWGAIGSFIDAAKRAGYISSDSKEDVEGLARALVNTKTIAGTSALGIENYSKSLSDLKTYVDDYGTFQKDLTTALSNSRGATGLTTEDVTKLKAAYSELKTADLSDLFEHTYNGIHLNEEALRGFNTELSEFKLGELRNAYAERLNAYNHATGDAKNAIRDEITDIQNLISEYEGLNSAYNSYVNSKSGGKERDAYEALGADYWNMQKLLEEGWEGDDTLTAYMDTILGTGRTADNAADRFALLTKQIEGTNHSLRDYWQYYDEEKKKTNTSSKSTATAEKLTSSGLGFFLQDVNTLLGDTYAHIEGVGDEAHWVFDLTGDKLQTVADRFGMSTEAVQIFERAMIDAGATVVLDNNNFVAMAEQLQKVQNNFEGLKGVDFAFNIKDMSIDELSAKREELSNAKATIDVDTEGAEEAVQMLDSLIASIEGREYQLKVQAQVEESGSSVDELLNADNKTIETTFNVSGEEEVQKVRDALEAINGESVEAAITVKLDDSQFSQLTGTEAVEIPVKYDVGEIPATEIEPVDVNINYIAGEVPDAEIPDEDVTVNYKANTSALPTSFPSVPRTVVYSADTGGLPESFPSITRYVNYVATGDVGGGNAAGTMTSIGVAHANGTAYNAPWNWINAYANGKVSLPKNEIALVNELGTESIIFICDIIQ